MSEKETEKRYQYGADDSPYMLESPEFYHRSLTKRQEAEISPYRSQPTSQRYSSFVSPAALPSSGGRESKQARQQAFKMELKPMKDNDSIPEEEKTSDEECKETVMSPEVNFLNLR
mmetsp:Transcript_34668/g.53096  ORF Transcript_34668/g.53096 Transcript_34668/m.53096 type:complete len:116 (+) Transcript_34668:1932-2279(+)